MTMQKFITAIKRKKTADTNFLSGLAWVSENQLHLQNSWTSIQYKNHQL